MAAPFGPCLHVRARLNAILRQHPRYEQDLLRGLPDGFEDRNLWAFMTVATWPDVLRSRTHPMSRTHDRPRWHFINFIFVPAGQRVERPDPPPERWVPGAEPDNILQAIE